MYQRLMELNCNFFLVKRGGLCDIYGTEVQTVVLHGDPVLYLE